MQAVRCILWVVLVFAGEGSAQEVPAPENLRQAMDDIEFAELLNSAQLTPDQLDALLELRSRLQIESAIEGELLTVLTKMMVAVLSGMTRQATLQALGPQQQQLLAQAQQRLQQSQEQAINHLRDLLSPEQQDTLIWRTSPARALDGAVDAVSQMRTAEPAQWNQFRQEAQKQLSQLSERMGGGAGASAEQIASLLDQARAMDQATFEARRSTLAHEWLPLVLPNIAQMVQSPQFREEQLRNACRHLLTYERGNALIEARQAMGTP